MTSHIEQFTETMHNAGLEPDAPVIDDGILHRLHDKQDKTGKNDLWYILFGDGIPAGSFGHWSRLPDGQGWQAKADNTLTTPERQKIRERREQAQAAREQALKEKRVECIAKANSMLKAAYDSKPDHAYLLKKSIKPNGAKQLKDLLLIPVRKGKTLTGLQIITPDGEKRFLTGTEKAGAYHVITGTGNTVYLCEGWATGCTIHEVTGATVIVCFDCGNLLPVCSDLKEKGPEYGFIICADNDRMKDDNTGLLKAVSAAKATGVKLAIPIFPGNDGTDFNDLYAISGAAAVLSCIEAAALVADQEEPPPVEDNPLTAAVDRLAKLSPLEYDKVRIDEAKAMGVRPGTLDAAVKTAKKQEEKADAPFDEVEPWPEPVNGALLLAALVATIRRFIICEQHTAVAAALWVVMSWFMDVVGVAPLALITAPEKRCGKTLLLTLISKLTPRPLTSSSITSSALFRSIDLWKPTLLIDETDACLKDNEELRGLINCGHTRSTAFTVRCVGDDHTPTKFNVWGAKALSGIGHPADTLLDRSIILELRRKLPNETVERIRHAEDTLFQELSAKLARFAADNSTAVCLARPILPLSLNDRAQDNWEPLLQIATVAGGDWYKTAVAAALKIAGGEDQSPTVGAELLADIQEIFRTKKIERIFSSELVTALCADDEKMWMTYNRGFPIKTKQLATKLKAYGVHSKSIRIGTENAKGFEIDQFKEAFARYAVDSPFLNVTTSQPLIPKDLSHFSKRHTEDDVTDEKTIKTAPVLTCDVVTDKIPEYGSTEVFDLTGVEFEVMT